MKKNRITIALQKKGRLARESLEFLSKLGINVEITNEELLVSLTDSSFDILLLRDDDIPRCVNEGLADFGIVGKNVLLESEMPLIPLKKLNFGECSLVIAVLNDSNINSINDLEAERIATSYPKIVTKYLLKEGICASILSLSGSVEAAPKMGLSDAICDITQTGTTLRENNLRVIATVMDSEAVLITNSTVKKFSTSSSLYKDFINKLNTTDSNNTFLTKSYACTTI